MEKSQSLRKQTFKNGESEPRVSNWTVRPNPEGQINRKPDDRIYDRRPGPWGFESPRGVTSALVPLTAGA